MSTTAPEKRDIRQLSLDDIKDFFVAEGEQSFRAKQVYEWLWKKSAKDFRPDDQHLAWRLREKLKELTLTSGMIERGSDAT